MHLIYLAGSFPRFFFIGHHVLGGKPAALNSNSWGCSGWVVVGVGGGWGEGGVAAIASLFICTELTDREISV